MNTSNLEKYFSDIKIAWSIILAGAGIAFLVGFLYMFLMRYCSGLFIWLAILCYFIAIAALAWLFLKKG